MLKHILAPLDNSEMAETALPYAQYLVLPDGLITLLTVLDLSEDFAYLPSAESMMEIQSSAQAQALEYLKSIAKRLRESHPTLKVNERIEIGDPASKILDLIEELTIDTIVMSTRGRSGLNRLLFGSVTEKVIFSATCPVYIVPGKVTEQPAELSHEEKLELLKRRQAAASIPLFTSWM